MHCMDSRANGLTAITPPEKWVPKKQAPKTNAETNGFFHQRFKIAQSHFILRARYS